MSIKKKIPLPAERNKSNNFFENFSSQVICATGSAWAFFIALGVIVVWAISGPIFGYSDTWQLVINTSTTIVTFLMVFVIQKSQNKESKSVQLKLNELIAASEEASNRLIDVEDLSEEELDVLHKYYKILADNTRKKVKMRETHSVEEAIKDSDEKLKHE